MNAYAIKTGLSRTKLSHLMESETWMNANKAVELGFADGVLERETDTVEPVASVAAMEFSRKLTNTALMNKLNAKYSIPAKAPSDTGTPVADIKERLNVIGKFI